MRKPCPCGNPATTIDSAKSPSCQQCLDIETIARGKLHPPKSERDRSGNYRTQYEPSPAEWPQMRSQIVSPSIGRFIRELNRL